MALESLGAVFSPLIVYVIFIVIIFMLVGFFSGSAAIGGYGGFMLFIYLAIELDIPIFEELLYLSFFGLIIFFSFRLVGELLGGDEAI